MEFKFIFLHITKVKYMVKCIEISIWLCLLDVRKNSIVSGSKTIGFRAVPVREGKRKAKWPLRFYFTPVVPGLFFCCF